MKCLLFAIRRAIFFFVLFWVFCGLFLVLFVDFVVVLGFCLVLFCFFVVVGLGWEFFGWARIHTTCLCVWLICLSLKD